MVEEKGRAGGDLEGSGEKREKVLFITRKSGIQPPPSGCFFSAVIF